MPPPSARLLLAVVLLAGACAAGPRPDPDAMREARRAGAERWVSPQAIASYLEAHRLMREGDATGAVEALRVAVAHDEGSAELRVSLAQALAEAGKLDRAEAEARRAIELARGEGRTATDAHVLLARLAFAARRLDDAARALRQAIRLETAAAADGASPDPTPWRLLADVFTETGDPDAATRALDDLAEKLPRDGTAFRELARGDLERHEPARAERRLRRAAQLDPRDAETFRLLAEAHEALRRQRDVREDLLAVVRLDPDDARALAALGRTAAQEGDVPRANEWFERFVRASRDPVEASLAVALQWLDAERAEEALAVARQALAGRPDARLHLVEGEALAMLRRWSDAATALQAVPESAGDTFVLARAGLADALSRAGRHAEAMRALAGPLAAHPADVRLVVARAAVLEREGRAADGLAALRAARDARERAGAAADARALTVALSEALGRAGRTGEAVELIRAALAREPRDAELLYALGAAHDRAGETDAAIADMRALLALDPDHIEALNFVGYTLAVRGERLDEAERLVRRALELGPRSGHVLDSLGWVLFRRGDVKRALELFEQADALGGPDPTTLEHLGDAYRALSRHADAERTYRRALVAPGEGAPAEEVRRRTAIERKLRELSASERVRPASLTPGATGR